MQENNERLVHRATARGTRETHDCAIEPRFPHSEEISKVALLPVKKKINPGFPLDLHSTSQSDCPMKQKYNNAVTTRT